MALLLQSLIRAVFSLIHPRVWLFMMLPAALSLLLWLGLAIWGLGALIDTLIELPPMSLLTAWGWLWLAHALAWVGGWMLVFACAYLTTALLAAVLIMPWLLRHVATRDYPDLAPAGSDSWWPGTLNSLLAVLLFAAGWIVTMPLWLIPGLSLVLPVLWMAWFNRRTFAYDALCVHASPSEWRELQRRHGRGFFLLGLALAALAHVPLLGLFVPAFATLAYLHYGLEALRRLRGDGAIVGEARVIAVE